MTDISELKRAVDRARAVHDELLEKVRLGVHVPQSELGNANRAFVAADAALLAAEEAATLAAKRKALLKMDGSDYEAMRSEITGGNFRRTLI